MNSVLIIMDEKIPLKCGLLLNILTQMLSRGSIYATHRELVHRLSRFIQGLHDGKKILLFLTNKGSIHIHQTWLVLKAPEMRLEISSIISIVDISISYNLYAQSMLAGSFPVVLIKLVSTRMMIIGKIPIDPDWYINPAFWVYS